ncbi:MAG: hypothetical protein DI594_21080 [Shewanella oneidensis]|nr:MAG: hypothetical protein DI594_21080 [Shewanella oneidensis]
MWCYLALIGAAGDSRAIDHSLTSDEMYWWEIVWLYIAVGSLFYIVACSVVHCFKNLSKFVALIVYLSGQQLTYMRFIICTKFHRAPANKRLRRWTHNKLLACLSGVKPIEILIQNSKIRVGNLTRFCPKACFVFL